MSTLSDLVDNMSSAAPVRTKVASASLRNALTDSQRAIESDQHSASQALQQAESNPTSVATQVFDTVGKAFQVEAAPQRAPAKVKRSIASSAPDPAGIEPRLFLCPFELISHGLVGSNHL